jgi:hypothetical protein
MDAEDIGTGVGLITLLGILVAGAWGWIMNIGTLLSGGDTMMTWELALRIGGVFMAPIGAVLGYF